MIKLFDFKFLILLTLAIVIYFMYKDMDEQRTRIEKLEEVCRTHLQNDNIIQIEEDENKYNKVDNLKYNKVDKPDNLKLELPKKMVSNIQIPVVIQKKELHVFQQHVEPELPKVLEVPELPKESEESDLTEESEESDLTEESEESDLPEESKLSVSEEEKDVSSVYQSNKSNQSKKSKKSILEIYSNDNNNSEETSISNLVSENLENVLNDLEIEINKDILPVTKYSLNNLSKLKVSELQDLAKNENISLDKKVNGSNKKKTKQDLINELCVISNEPEI